MSSSSKKIAIRAALAFLGFLGLATLAVGAFAVGLVNADLKPLLERQASDDLQRRVTIGAVTVGWGDPLAIEFTDLSIANASWGSVPDMVRIGHLSALIDMRALFRGVLRYEKLRVDEATIVLERNSAGIGNWKFAGDGLGGNLAIVPKDRTQFPILIDSALTNGLITFRTSSGQILRLALGRAAARAPAEGSPIILEADLAYNDVVARLDAIFESSIVLRDPSRPVGARFTITGKDAIIAFNGAMMEPLDFEGVRGSLNLEAQTLNDLLKQFGIDATAKIPFVVSGDLERDGADWSLSKASGQLGKDAFNGGLALDEAGRGEPDDIAADLHMKVLDIDAHMSQIGDAQKTKQDVTALPLQMDLTGVNVEAKLTSDQVTLAATRLPAAQFNGRLASGEVTLHRLSFALAGGTVSVSGSLQQVKAGGHLSLTAALSKADADMLAQQLGASDGVLRGQIEGAGTLDMTGTTVGAALKTGHGAAIVAMNNGDVARDLIEQVSADLRNLFREGEGRVPVACLLGVLALEDGIGVISPLRLESREATLVGVGTVDFGRKRLDLALKTDSDTTGIFALDVPIVVTGPFKALRVMPLADSERRVEKPAGNAVLPAALREMMRGNACAG